MRLIVLDNNREDLLQSLRLYVFSSILNTVESSDHLPTDLGQSVLPVLKNSPFREEDTLYVLL